MARSAFAGFLAGAALVGATASAAAASSVTYADGRKERLAPAQEVTGPAVVTTDDGTGTIRLRAGAVLRFLGEDVAESGDRSENFFLKEGAAEAELGFFSRLATAAFWVFPDAMGQRAEVFVAARGENAGYARATATSNLVRLFVSEVEGKPLEVALLAGQGASVIREKSGGLRFWTDADNAWIPGGVRLLYPVGSGGVVDVYVPKATELSVGPDPGSPARIQLGRRSGSWKGGALKVDLIQAPGTGRADAKDAASLVIRKDDAATPTPAATVAREASKRGLRNGTLLLDGRVEVVEMRADFVSGKPRLAFTLEHVDSERPKEPIHGLRYRVEFARDGKVLDAGEAFRAPRPVEDGLSSMGSRVEVVVPGLERAGDLVGAWPVLHLTR